MKYGKPELLVITAAVSAIQSHNKGGSVLETIGPPATYSTAAYEADE